jgi:hypothetical protein
MVWSDALDRLKRKLFKYRLKKEYRKKFRVILLSVLIIFVAMLIYGPISRGIDSLLHPNSYGKVKVDWYHDYNSVHLRYAKRSGFAPFNSTSAFRDGLKKLLREDKLVKISSNKYYVVKRLSHSHPYLTPEAAQLLEDIGKRFRKKLDENGMGNYAYHITSLLRTKESQKSLSRSNTNASSNTSHLYGTTFDIAYRSVAKRPLPWMTVEVYDAKAIKLLSEAIGELRRERRCVVVTERIEKCFHITVIQ